MTSPTLYVCSRSSRWLAAVSNAAKDTFVVKVVKCQVSEPLCRAELGHPHRAALILIDSALGPDVENSASILRKAGWKYVVVVAANPTWRQARAVLRGAGGFDYWSRTYDPRILRADLMRCWQEMTVDSERATP